MPTVTRTPVYTAIDGATFADRKEAVARSKFVQRQVQVRAALDSEGIGLDGIDDDDLAKHIAVNAEALLAALDVSERRPRKPKAPVAA